MEEESLQLASRARLANRQKALQPHGNEIRSGINEVTVRRCAETRVKSPNASILDSKKVVCNIVRCKE